MVTTFPLISAGWRAAVGWYPEATYGTAVPSVQYYWVGAVQNLKATIDKNPIFVYRMNGNTNFPAYLLKGQRNVDFTITYWPQPLSNTGVLSDLGLLVDDINNIGINTVSHSFVIKDFENGNVYTVTGAVANSVRISGKTGAALEVEITYWCQNILDGLPTGVTFPNDPGIATPVCIPFYFSQESIQVPAGTPKAQALTFTATITNNLQRVPQFGTDVIRSIPTLTRKADGTLTATYDTIDVAGSYGFANESKIPYTTAYADTETAPSGLSQQEISLKLGTLSLPATNYYLNYTGAVLPKIDLTTPIADLVALSLDWTATNAAVSLTT
jgi:hypothetical protein